MCNVTGFVDTAHNVQKRFKTNENSLRLIKG